jgi:hypothetical protein
MFENETQYHYRKSYTLYSSNLFNQWLKKGEEEGKYWYATNVSVIEENINTNRTQINFNIYKWKFGWTNSDMSLSMMLYIHFTNIELM